MLLLLLACQSELACGPGTHAEDGLCLPNPPASGDSGAADDSAADDSAPGDSGAAAELQVYLLAGQSNMDGYGVITGLPPSWLEGGTDVPLYWSGWGEFRALAPASYGGAFYTGPEVSLGQTLAAAGQHLALVKHAVGGTDLYSYWYPGDSADETDTGPGWSVLVESLRAAEAELDAAGEPWRWAGFVWMQGESDALDATMTEAYAENLERLLRRVREETGEPELPAAIGLIACEGLCTYLDEVRAAQQEVVEADGHATAVETLDLPRNIYDTWHYDGPSTRLLGERFAQALLGQPPDAAVQAALKIDAYAVNYDGDFTVGWVFTTDRAITITDVGGFAEPGTFLYTSSELGIWDNNTADLIARETVPSWYEAPTTYRDGFWYTAVDPIRLEPGTYAVGLVSWGGDVDRYADGATVEVGDAIEVDAAAYVESYWLAYPSTQINATARALSFLGPGFLYTTD